MKDKEFINNEVATYMTNNKLLAFSDRLNSATPKNFANLHAKDERNAQKQRIYSTIGILASDFSKGKGTANIRAQANITAAEARYIFTRIQMGLNTLDGQIFSSEKIFGNPDKEGYAPVRKLIIGRAAKDTKGADRKSPWYVIVENGKAIKVKNANGGAYAKSMTFQSQSKIIVYLTDQDFYCLLSEVVSYINVWEITFGSKLLREGRALFDDAKATYTAEHKTNSTNNQHAPPQPTQSPLNTPPSQSVSTGGMTLDTARAVKIGIGKHKGKTLGQLKTEWPEGISWYITDYNGKNESLRKGAQVIMNNLRNAA
jgi:hypothetical protein